MACKALHELSPFTSDSRSTACTLSYSSSATLASSSFLEYAETFIVLGPLHLGVTSSSMFFSTFPIAAWLPSSQHSGKASPPSGSLPGSPNHFPSQTGSRTHKILSSLHCLILLHSSFYFLICICLWSPAPKPHKEGIFSVLLLYSSIARTVLGTKRSTFC